MFTFPFEKESLHKNLPFEKEGFIGIFHFEVSM